MDTVGFLMMSSHTTPENLLEEVKKIEFYGVGTIYVFDSAGRGINDEIHAGECHYLKKLKYSCRFPCS